MRRDIFDEDHELFRDSFRQFLARHVTPNYERWEAEGIVDRELFSAAGEAGFIGFGAPEEFGGGGVRDFRYNVIIGEEIQEADAGAAGLGLTLHTDICLPYFLDLTTEEQKARWLPGVVSGELITAVGMTEPGAGSDLAGMKTTATETATATWSTGRRRSSPTASTLTWSSSPARPTRPSATRA